MRFQEALGILMKENLLLKAALIISSLSSVMMTLGFMMAASRPPIVISEDRSTILETLEPDERTEKEIENFVRVSLSQRFNTEATDTNLLSEPLRELRSNEQKELERNKMLQFLIVEDIRHEKETIHVAATRLIVVGEIRSAFQFPLEMSIQRVRRTTTNPLGLILTEAKPIKENEGVK